MDFSESTKVVYDRVQKIEPENVSKIIGYLLLQDHGEREMIRLAFGPDNLIHALINKAKTHLKLPSNTTVGQPSSPPQVNSLPDMPIDQMEPVNSPDFSSGHYYSPEPALGPRANRRSPSLPEFPFKVCHYFIKGFCRHGNNCRYLHPTPESFSQIFNSKMSEDDNVFSPMSLEKLELELTELLKSRRGFPVSIASLPMIYYEKFGKTLQAEGYLTESQRHGKAGYSLTKLLARLKSICLIDRPHGQHAVVLADDMAKCMDHIGDRNEHGGIVAGSRQIYLTFPAESTFSELDVYNYFNKFGPVRDVRIPCQQKRMFGFVTFVFADTVRHILNKGNPHFVSGARVLVKPYREKCKIDDRKHGYTYQHPMYQGSHCLDSEFGLHSSNAHAQQTDFNSTERFNHFLDALSNDAASDDKFRQINTEYNEQESQGLNLPDSPFASGLGGEISTVI
ncbi:putative transcription factor C3H family [Helianthus debilis subsp. tardiflorus]